MINYYSEMLLNLKKKLFSTYVYVNDLLGKKTATKDVIVYTCFLLNCALHSYFLNSELINNIRHNQT